MSNSMDIFNKNNNQLQGAKSGTEMMMNRQAQEVQAAMIVAKKFPRDESEAYNRILIACQRQTLAIDALYSYPRGGTKVEGPSIRMAEVLAQNWGNIDYGIVELEQKNGESQVMAYAWDLETNTRQTKIFSVPHKRFTRNGSKKLEDPRDIYEMVANQGARRLRACILGIIPGDVIDKAVEQCKMTVKNNLVAPLKDLIRDMLKMFKDKFSVSKEHIEEYFGFKVEAFTANEYNKLISIGKSIQDGMSSREDWFKIKNESSVPNTFKKDEVKKEVVETPPAPQESPVDGFKPFDDEDIPENLK